jgi:hypothetical protein
MAEFGLQLANLVNVKNPFLGMDIHVLKLILAQMEKFGTYLHLVVNVLKLHIGTEFNAKICLNVNLGKS